MAVVACVAGHFYDDVKHASCPHCDAMAAAGADADAAGSAGVPPAHWGAAGRAGAGAGAGAPGAGAGSAAGIVLPGEDLPTQAFFGARGHAAGSVAAINASLAAFAGRSDLLGQDSPTIDCSSGRKGQKGSDPVTGWLVCVEGAQKGKDWRLHSGQNFIGRSWASDVAITEDPQISRENHCRIVFEPHDASFFIVPGDGTNTWLDGERLSAAAQLYGAERMQIGDSVLIFVPFCGKAFSWL